MTGGIGEHRDITMLSTCEETGIWHCRARHATPLLPASSPGKRSQGNLWHPVPLEVDICSGWLGTGCCGWCRGTLSPHPSLPALSGSSAVEAWGVPTLSPGKQKVKAITPQPFPAPCGPGAGSRSTHLPSQPSHVAPHAIPNLEHRWESWGREDRLGEWDIWAGELGELGCWSWEK